MPWRSAYCLDTIFSTIRDASCVSPPCPRTESPRCRFSPACHKRIVAATVTSHRALLAELAGMHMQL
ncbi:unnamed protein product [Linum trigynum]|uniref:Uncharacterized protein n=1 Tax=Linum trigynum TaxID=586398 RepID=A0AAV2GPN8_9ROSI